MSEREQSRTHQLAIRAFEKDLAEANKEIARWTRQRNEALMMIRKLMGDKAPPKTARPWQLVRDRARDEGRPLTWDEAYQACAILEQIAMKLEPIEDLKRMVALANELKCVNNLVGLAEWPEEKFNPPASPETAP